MKITIVGTGYVGLVVGTCLADMGNDVICIDNDEEKIAKLNQLIMPIYEPGLKELVKTNIKEERLTFSCDIENAVKVSDVCFIAVGTPLKDDGSVDLEQVEKVVEKIAKSINGYKVIVDKSTVPVGTAEKLTEKIKSYTNQPFDIVSNPEFLKQGNAVEDFLKPDRIIVGSNSQRAIAIMQEIYSPFVRTGNRVVVMDVKSAEMTKYAANSFLATKISFMNEIANLCEKVGADIENVRVGISTDSRIGNKFLFSGLGYGGSCFPKDVKALVKLGYENGCKMSVVKATDEVNVNQRELFIKKITDKYGKDLSGLTFAVWGLAFKPKTNDMREAPSITIINRLIELGANVQAYDPRAIETAKNIFKSEKITYGSSSYSVLKNADCMLLLTEWNEFRIPDFKKIKELLKTPVIFDGRNQYNAQALKDLGFEYYQIGKC
ncbi:MAG: UDP-glucose/GDP-mannose dehydrogenase family protein [bacterium]|nr:UDP-glucose/GDP-mannose dehydrogenase family protein [bacterium]